MGGRTVVILFGPKGVGKTTVAKLLARALGVRHVDADPMIRALVDQGIEPEQQLITDIRRLVASDKLR